MFRMPFLALLAFSLLLEGPLDILEAFHREALGLCFLLLLLPGRDDRLRGNRWTRCGHEASLLDRCHDGVVGVLVREVGVLGLQQRIHGLFRTATGRSERDG